MAAATLVERGIPGSDIFLFDKNPRIGVKVGLTGGGRCNVTTGITQRKELFPKYIRGADFLKHAFEIFGPRKVYQWFEQNGLPLYIQSDNRVFPRSNKWQDVVEVFEAIFSEKWVNLRLNESVKWMRREKLRNWETESGFLLETDKDLYEFDRVIIATGWNAYSHTGSSGDGYNLAQALGHTITPLGPSLNSFEVKESWCKNLSGIALQNAKLICIRHTELVSVSPHLIHNTSGDPEMNSGWRAIEVSVIWPMLFTHFGISGPATFALSAHIALEKISPDSPITIWISLDANKDFQVWDNELRIAFESEPNKLIKTLLTSKMPARICEVIMSELWIDRERTAARFSKDERKKLVHILTGQLKITLVNRRPWDEFVTAGWIELSEVDPKTMQSKLVPGLFFGGEVLDVDAVTWGFNLQSAWAMGRIAGLNI